MQTRRLLATSCIALSLLAEPLLAQEKAPGWQDYVAGDFEAAFDTASKGASADAYALACRSKMVLGGYFQKNNKAVDSLHTAIDFCTRAIELEKDHMIGNMTYAMTIAFEGKRLTSPRYASRARKVFERMQEIYPDNPLAQAAIGSWHSEVYAAGFFARTALGASRKIARAAFNKALAMGELDIPLTLEYAKYLAYGNKDERQKSIRVLKDLIAAKPQHGFDALIQKSAAKLLPALQSGKKSRIKAAIKEISAFHGIEDWDDRDSYDLKPLKNT